MRFKLLMILCLCSISAFAQTKHISDRKQDIFWTELQKLCGKAYEGKMIAGPENDTTFANKTLIMRVLKCNKEQIYIPFFVGADRSRTWIFTQHKKGLSLKHDHRHLDGKPDSITFYGGHTTNHGSATRQIFPADQETADMLPAAIGNVWWVDLVPGEYFNYNLRRVNTDRVFTIRFDLKKEINTEQKPWGWKE